MGIPMPPRFPPSLFASQVRAARYYRPEVPRSPQSLEIVCAGWEDCRSEYDLVRRSFPWFGVELIARGKGWLEIQGGRHPLRTGAVFCYSPTTSLRITAERERPFLKYFVVFAGTNPRHALALGPLRVNRVLQALYSHELQGILDQMINEGNRKSEASMAIATAYLRIFFRKLHESTEEARGSGAEVSRALRSFLHAKAFIEENFTRLTRVEDASRELGMAPETLCRLFHRFSTDSPYQLLLTLRMNLAVDLLLGTDLLIKQVAERAGFDDPFHFSRVFKRTQGISPAAFQHMYKPTAAG
jgi:AraC family transcriptional regulator